jgi:hypothetical protein
MQEPESQLKRKSVVAEITEQKKIVGALRLNARQNTARKRQSILTWERTQGLRQDLGCDHGVMK